MSDPVQMIRECLRCGGDLSDTIITIWLENEKQGKDLSNKELNSFVIQAVKELI